MKQTTNNLGEPDEFSIWIFFFLIVEIIYMEIVKKKKKSFGLLFFFFIFYRATPMAYGGSQARGLVRAVATSLCQSHSNMGSEPYL